MTWQDRLTGGQRALLGLAKSEIAGDELPFSLMASPSVLRTLADMAELLDQAETPDLPVSRMVLPVPYHSQWEGDAELIRKDCGPACVEMLGEYYHPELQDISTDDITKYITGGADRATSISELQRAFDHYYGAPLDRHGVANWDMLKKWIGDGHPAIVLVHYGSFLTRMDRNYTSGHYMVVCGFDRVYYQGQALERVILHDPDFYGVTTIGQGAFIPVIKSHFLKMWDDCYKDQNPRCLALVRGKRE